MRQKRFDAEKTTFLKKSRYVLEIASGGFYGIDCFFVQAVYYIVFGVIIYWEIYLLIKFIKGLICGFP